MVTYGNLGIVSLSHDAYVSREQGRSLLALSSIVGLTGADPESRTAWIHVAPFGEWKGHSEGSFALTADHFEAVKAVLANKSTPVSLDYEHASIRPKGGPTPAAGYANAVEVRSDGLWARVEFTQRAAEMIRAGEYRFCSGVFDFASVDPETGEPLLCVLDTIALTNRPFIDGQTPIALSRPVALSNGVTMSEIDLKALAKLLDAIPGPNTADKIKKAIDLMSASDVPAEAPKAEAEKADASAKPVAPVALNAEAPAVALADKAADAAPCADPAPMPMADAPPVADADADSAVDDVDAKLMAATGLDLDGLAAAIEANFDAVVALLMGAAPADNAALSRGTELIIKGKDAQIVSLTKELNTLRTEKREREAKAIEVEVDALIRRAPALASERASFVTLARTAPAEFRRVATAIAPVAPDLTRPHAVALTQSQGSSDHAPTVVDDNHPQLVATRASLSRVFTGEALEKAIAKAKQKIAAG